jgi:hypothetical protein
VHYAGNLEIICCAVNELESDDVATLRDRFEDRDEQEET